MEGISREVALDEIPEGSVGMVCLIKGQASWKAEATAMSQATVGLVWGRSLRRWTQLQRGRRWEDRGDIRDDIRDVSATEQA